MAVTPRDETSVFSAGSRSSEYSFGFLTMKMKGDLVVFELLDYSTGRPDAGVECLFEQLLVNLGSIIAVAVVARRLAKLDLLIKCCKEYSIRAKDM